MLFFFFKKIYLFYLFIFGCVGSSCCAWAFSSCSKWGLLFVVVHGLLIAVASHCSGFSCYGARALGTRASVVVAHGLQSTGSVVVAHGLSCPATWDLPGPGLELLSPALAGGFLTTAPPGKPAPCSSSLTLPPLSSQATAQFLVHREIRNRLIYPPASIVIPTSFPLVTGDEVAFLCLEL